MPPIGLGNVALSVVARHGPMHWRSLVGYLVQRHGASPDEANQAIAHLLQVGALVQTDSHVLSVGPHAVGASRPGGNMLGITASVLGIIAAGLAIVEILFRTGTIEGQSPAQVLEDWVWPTIAVPVVNPDGGDPGVPTFPNEPPDRPLGLTLRGDCDTGFTLEWRPAEGAASYRIERDGNFFGTARQQTWFNFAPMPDNEAHRYTATAVSQFGVRSPPSDYVDGSACTFP